MPENPLLQLQSFGQSVWLDFIHRSMLDSGELGNLIASDGVSGVTSNPKIFADAIAKSDVYDGEIRDFAAKGWSARRIYEHIAIADVGRAADLLLPLYERTGFNDGFVSIEVSPELAYDTDGTVEQALFLWRELRRPNVLIKIPGTREGLPAIRRVIALGVNVNVTLLFGLDRYREVIDSYLGGIEDRISAGESVNQTHSVASFFLSRIDALVDPMLPPGSNELRGTVAIASARLAFRIFKEIFTGSRFRELAKRGAKMQRLLWASTGTKNPEYSDVMYVEALIGPFTINTMPLETMSAYRDHGRPAARLETDLEAAGHVFELLLKAGIDPVEISCCLEEEGVRKFAEPFAALLETLERKRS